MENTKLLKTFEIYYDTGIVALKQNDYPLARRNVLAAAETLLSIAKRSTGVTKAQRLKKATELYELANKIGQEEKIANNNDSLK